MSNLETTKQAVASSESGTGQNLEAIITKAAKDFGQVLPNHMKSERIVRIALTCIRKNEKLARCTPASFMGALMTSAQLGIEPIAGRAYILPFFNSKKKADGSWHKELEAEFVLGYKGVVELFYRHSKAGKLDWSVVHKQDEFNYEYGTDAFLKHRPSSGDRGPAIGFWVCATLAGGEKIFKYATVDELMEHGEKHSKTFDKKAGRFFDDSPWSTEPEAMCLKTLFLQVAKLLPLSIDIQRALEADETSRDYRAGVSDALDLPTTTHWGETGKPTTDDIEFGAAPPNLK